MSKVAGVLSAEIVRLSRREVRQQTKTLQKMSASYRRDIASLKRRLAELERQVKQAGKSTQIASVLQASESTDRPMRFVVKGFVSLRKRLGLSARQFGTLLNVSEQSIYNWESGKTVPRRSQLPMIARARGMGKLEALAAIESAK